VPPARKAALPERTRSNLARIAAAVRKEGAARLHAKSLLDLRAGRSQHLGRLLALAHRSRHNERRQTWRRPNGADLRLRRSGRNAGRAGSGRADADRIAAGADGDQARHRFRALHRSLAAQTLQLAHKRAILAP